MIPELDKDTLSARIAKNIAALVDTTTEQFVMNLGVGIPTMVSEYVTNPNIYLQAENGMVGVGPLAEGDQIHPLLINASRQPVIETPGCAYMDSSASFAMIRGGHVDATVLGAFEVDQDANVANWIIPNGKQLGVGGAMDLVAGAKKVIIAMSHTNKGKSKLIKKCTLPITGAGEVDVVVTEIAVFFVENGKYILKKIAPEATVDDVKSVTELDFEVDPKLEKMLP
ncbi:succinyl-CoA--3-ketoacid-CoA transferase [Desulfovibrio sp. OttesenSCG-928-O18]|nr:succinyl-CoA--3-ketoacid-CoA transferase [Desulfovibrio sp. OttesenSCG-928-O18]